MFRIGPFELDSDRFELRRAGTALAVQRKVLEAILYLVRKRDRLVSKEELKGNVWSGTSVSDAAIHRVMMVARRLLTEEGSAPILTVHGKGYRFVGEVRLCPASGTDNPHAAPVTEVAGPATAAAPPSSRRCEVRPFVGRRSELKQLRRALADAKAGRGGLLLIGGEPGIGKTRLLQALADLARAEGCEVWLGRGWEGGGAPAFWPWTEAMRCGMKLRGPAATEQLLGDECSDLLTLLPGWFHQPEAGEALQLPDDAASARFRVFDLLTRLVFAASETVPVVLMLDDLHAADEATVLLARFMSQTLTQRRVLLIAAYRNREAQDNKAVATFISAAPACAERTMLGGLDSAEVFALLQALAGSEVSERYATSICKMANGNPFLIQELGRSAPTFNELEARATIMPLPLPERAAKCIRDHVQRLPDETRRALEIASVMGRSFWLEELPALAGDSQKASNSGLDLIEPAWSEGLVEPDGSAPGAFRFNHQLVRDTIYGDLSPSRRYELHFAAANALEANSLGENDTIFQIAHHHLIAVPLRGTKQALRWAREAGTRALQGLAYEQAVEQYATMVQLLQRGPSEQSQLCDALLMLGAAQAMAGQMESAIDTFKRVIALGTALGEAAIIGRGALGWFRAVDIGCLVHPALEEHLTDALARIDSPPALRSELSVALACCAAQTMPLAERRRLFEEGLLLAANSPTSATLTSALACSMAWNFFWNDPQKGLELSADVMVNAKASGNFQARLHGHLWRGTHHLQLGNIAELNQEMAEHSRLAQRIRHPFHLYASELSHACRSQLIGDLVEAEARARLAFSKGEQVIGMSAGMLLGLQLLTIALERGLKAEERLDLELQTLMQEMAGVGLSHQMWPIMYTRFAVERGALADARRRLTELAPEGKWAWPADETMVPTACQLAIIAAALEDSAVARNVIGCLLPYAGRHVATFCFGAYWGPISYYLGIAAATLGDATQARLYLEQGREEAARVGARSYQAWASYALARLAMRHGKPSHSAEAARHLRESSELAQLLGLAKLADKVSAASRQLPSSSPERHYSTGGSQLC